MTTTNKTWLTKKREELARLYERERISPFSSPVSTWDTVKYLEIIDAQAGEIRRLMTQLGAKE